MGLGIVRLDADRLAIGDDRLVETAPVAQRSAEVRIGLGIVRLDADRLATCGDCRVEPALVSQRNAEVGEIKWILSILFYSPTDQFDGNVVASRLLRNDSEQVQGICMLRLGRQHVPITSLGLGQSSRLVVFDAIP